MVDVSWCTLQKIYKAHDAVSSWRSDRTVELILIQEEIFWDNDLIDDSEGESKNRHGDKNDRVLLV